MFDFLNNLFGGLFSQLGGFFGSLFTTIGNFFNGIITFFSNAFTGFFNGIVTFFTDIFKPILDLIYGILYLFQQVFTLVVLVLKVVSALFGLIGSLAGGIVNTITGFTAWNGSTTYYSMPDQLQAGVSTVTGITSQVGLDNLPLVFAVFLVLITAFVVVKIVGDRNA